MMGEIGQGRDLNDDLTAFRDELRLRTRSSAVVAGWLLVLVYPAWSFFDLALVPDQAASFITLRLAGEVVVIALWVVLRSPGLPPRWLEPLVFALFAVPTMSIAWMLPRSQPELEAYLLGYSTLLYGTAVVLTCRWQLGAGFVGLAAASTALFSVLEPDHLDRRDVAVMAIYLVTAGTIALAGHVHRYRTGLRQFITQRALDRQQEENAVLVAELQHLSRHDELTRLANRRAWDEWIEGEVHRSKRSGAPLSIIFGDVDRLKEVNDRLGHAAGDAVIRSVADLLRGRLRATDFVARVGGDEFVIGCPDTDLAGATELAHQLAGDAPGHRWPEGLELSMSFGVAELGPDDAGRDDLMQRVDAALYRAKLTRGAVSF